MILDCTYLKKYFNNSYFLLNKATRKLSVLFSIALFTFITCCTTANAQGLLDKPVTIHLSNAGLVDALSAIGDQAAVNISYSSTKLDVKRKVSLNVKEKPLKSVLEELIGPSLYKLNVKGNTITIQSSNGTGTVSGIVKLADGLPGAYLNVSIKGGKSTITDAEGNFSIQNVDAGPQTVNINGFDIKQSIVQVEVHSNQTNTLDVTVASQNNSLNEFVVVSARMPQHISDIPGTVWVIDSTELQTQIKAGIPLKEALWILIPGMDNANQGRTNYAQNIRGRNIQVMLNGVTLNSTRNTSRQFDAIDPFNIEKIEVLSGASALYGGDATGGIINIVTKKPTSEETTYQTEVGIRTGFGGKDDHDLRIAQSIAAGNEIIQGRLGLALQQNGAAYDANGDQVMIDVKQGDLQYNRTIDLFGNLEVKLKKSQKLSFDAQFYTSKYNSKTGLYFGENLAGALPAFANGDVQPNPDLLDIRKGFDSDINPGSKRFFLNAQYRNPNFPGGQTFLLQAFGRSERLDFSPSFPEGVNLKNTGIATLPLAASRQNTDLYGIKAVLSKNWEKVNITYGIDFDHERFEGRQAFFDTLSSYSSGGLINRTSSTLGRYPGNKIKGISGFAQVELNPINNLTISGGVRRQHMNVEVEDFVSFLQQVSLNYGIGTSADVIPGGKNNYNVTLFNGNILYKFNSALQTWASYSEGFSVPDPTKYYGTGAYTLNDEGHWTVSNSVNVAETPLSGIKTKQTEVGFRLRSPQNFKAQLAGFYAVSDKALVVDRAAFTISVSDQKVRNYGFEGELSYSPNKGFELGANGQLLISEIKIPEKGYERNSIISSNPSKFGAFMGYRHSKFTARLQATHSLDLKDFQGLELKGFTTLDLVGNVKLPVGNLAIGVNNLLNNQYVTFWGQRAVLFYGAPSKLYQYNARGRTFSLTYTITY